MREAKRSTTSVDGVIGYPEAKRAPAARQPSQQAWSPSRKCVPVSTPLGSACIVVLLLRRIGEAVSVDGEVRAVHAAQIAAAALFRRHHLRRVVALGIEGRGQCQDLSRTELDAEATGFATLDLDRNRAFCHQILSHRGWQPGSQIDVINTARGSGAGTPATETPERLRSRLVRAAHPQPDGDCASGM